MKVYKYALFVGRVAVEMPEGARVLTAHEQDGQVYLWALVDPSATLVLRLFVVVGTGHNTEARADQYIGTAFVDPFVWHVFEVAA